MLHRLGGGGDRLRFDVGDRGARFSVFQHLRIGTEFAVELSPFGVVVADSCFTVCVGVVVVEIVLVDCSAKASRRLSQWLPRGIDPAQCPVPFGSPST